MRIATFVLLGAGALLTGCIDTSGPASEPVGGKGKPGADASSARVSSGLIKFFQSHYEAQSNGGTSVERFRDCDENGVLVGFGGRVDGSSNFTDLTVYCSDIDAHGRLGPQYIRTIGGTSQEASVIADPGYVVVAVSGNVANNNLVMASVRQCQWDPVGRQIKTNSCSHKYSGSGAEELYYGIYLQDRQAVPHPRFLLTGVGLTASNSNLSVIRVTVGEVEPVYWASHWAPINLAQYETQNYTYVVDGTDKWVGFLTSEGTGDLDIYVKKGSPPTVFDYDCVGSTGSNWDACEVTSAGTYYIMLRGYTAVANASFDVKYLRW